MKYMIVLLLFLTSCKPENNRLFKFDPTILAEDEITLSELSDSIIYIPLDNIYPIGRIFNYKLINNSIFLSAKDVGILKFNLEGRFQNRIGDIGRGPAEYNYFMEFAIDKNNESVYIMDYTTIKVFSKSGSYLRSIPLEYTEGFFPKIDFFDSKLFLSEFILAGKAKYNWIILDSIGGLIVQKKNSIPAFKSVLLKNGGTFLFDGRINYWNTYNDTVFSISPDLTYKELFLFSPGEYRLPRSEYDPGKKASDYMLLGSIFETRQYYVLNYYYARNAIALIEKETKKSFVSYQTSDEGSPGFLNDLDGGLNFKPGGYYSEGGREFMSEIISPFELKSHVLKNKKSSNQELRKNLELLADSIKDTDNPVLMLVRLKK